MFWSKFIVHHRHCRRSPSPSIIVQCYCYCRFASSSVSSIATSTSPTPTLRYDRDSGIIFLENDSDTSSSKTFATPPSTRLPLYQTVIGIEIHAQLMVPTKLFSSAPTRHRRIHDGLNSDHYDDGSTPNENVHAIDIAYPGTLPQPISTSTINASLLSAIVLNCNNIHTISRFERKHYFYGDLPQGYQITQQRWPIARDGLVVFLPHVATRSNAKLIVDGAGAGEGGDDDGVPIRRRGMRNRRGVQENNHPDESDNDVDERNCQTRELIESLSSKSSSTSSPPDPVQLRIERIQIEQDTGRTIVGSSSSSSSPVSHYSYVDHNRTGCALIEIVSHPDLRSAHEAAGAVSRIRKLLQMANVCDGKMEEGSLRCDLNVSIAPIDIDDVIGGDEESDRSAGGAQNTRMVLPPNTGHRVEVKNLNSIRQIIAATEYEALRQSKLAQLGTPTGRETRTLVVGSGGMADETVCIRAKGDAVDYRFMPEPDLPPLILDEETLGCTLDEYVDKLRTELGESPEDAASRLVQDYGLTMDVAGVITGDTRAILLFEETVKFAKNEYLLLKNCDDDDIDGDENMLSTLAANWLCNDLFALAKTSTSANEGNIQSTVSLLDYSSIDGQRLGGLIAMVAHGSLTSSMAKKVLNIMFVEGGRDHPRDIATANGWQVVSDKKTLIQLCNSVVFDPKNASQLEQYKTGEERKRWKIEKYFVGKIMAASKGNAHPELMKEALSTVLEKACIDS
ncbi:hypothetical protein ACHAWU_009709 [Discostella pseudostelligera]|uniref:Glutamyl-tRNA(Gln) amidotransferase subunit B, mitochondrial n=1 Tax=Discostella pseudostelligera TaxID=259834 RepID=A0ABD3MUY1_9STRA